MQVLYLPPGLSKIEAPLFIKFTIPKRYKSLQVNLLNSPKKLLSDKKHPNFPYLYIITKYRSEYSSRSAL